MAKVKNSNSFKVTQPKLKNRPRKTSGDTCALARIGINKKKREDQASLHENSSVQGKERFHLHIWVSGSQLKQFHSVEPKQFYSQAIQTILIKQNMNQATNQTRLVKLVCSNWPRCAESQCSCQRNQLIPPNGSSRYYLSRNPQLDNGWNEKEGRNAWDCGHTMMVVISVSTLLWCEPYVLKALHLEIKA